MTTTTCVSIESCRAVKPKFTNSVFFTLTLDGCCKVLCTSLLSAVSMHVIDADDLYAVGSSRDSTLIVSELEQKSNSTVTAWQILNISVTTDSF